MSLAAKITGLQEDYNQTLDAMKRRVMQRAISQGQDPDAAWREAEPTYRGMLDEPAQRMAIGGKDHERGEVNKFHSIHQAAEEAMRSAGEGPARDKLQQIMVLTQELMQMHESGPAKKTSVVESILGI